MQRWVQQLVMNKLADVALLPFYCQNTLVVLLLINFKLAWSYILKLKKSFILNRIGNYAIELDCTYNAKDPIKAKNCPRMVRNVKHIFATKAIQVNPKFWSNTFLKQRPFRQIKNYNFLFIGIYIGNISF